MDTKEIQESTNTKDAIRFVKEYVNVGKFDQDKARCVIELLQCGEKYEAIVKEIKYEIDWHRPEREVYGSGSKGDDEYINETLDLIDKIEQKYFPKPSKDFTKKVVEKIKEAKDE